jgi:hypothetical protein
MHVMAAVGVPDDYRDRIGLDDEALESSSVSGQ